MMPLLILMGAGVAAYWGSQRASSQKIEVEHYVRQVCESVLSAGDAAQLINAADPFVEQQVIAELHRVCDLAQSIDAVEIIVNPGDVPDAGSLAGKATHRVVLRVNGIDQLGLRVQRAGENDIRLLGYWLPQVQRPVTSMIETPSAAHRTSIHTHANLVERQIRRSRSSIGFYFRCGFSTWRWPV